MQQALSSKITNRFGTLVVPGPRTTPDGLTSAFRCKATYESDAENIIVDTCLNDIRWLLWSNGHRTTTYRGQKIATDFTPFRWFWGHQFIEPHGPRSWLWKIAPFETRLLLDRGPVLEYVFHWTVEQVTSYDDERNARSGCVSLGQLTRAYRSTGQAFHVTLFRWNPFKK